MSDDPTKLGPGEEWDATKDATKEAAKQGVDMGAVEGTGTGGTVTKDDVTAHVADKKAQKAKAAAKPKAAKKAAAVESAQAEKEQSDLDKAKADQEKKTQAALLKLESEPIPGRRLGRLPTPPAMLKKNLKLAKYMPEILPATPALPLDVTDGVHDWPVYLNDRLGDCACAAPAHMEEIFAADTRKFRIPTDADVLALYELQGYNPADPSTDQGSSMGNVLIDWRTQWSASGIYAYCQVDQKNEDHVKLSLWLFRGLYIGIALPLTAQGQAIWDVIPDMPGRNEPGSWGGHAVSVVAINADSSRDVITWGQRIKMTKAFWDEYVDEVYAVVTQDLKAGDKLAVNGFDVDQLEADMAEIGSA
jgi:hypothetical protein